MKDETKGAQKNIFCFKNKLWQVAAVLSFLTAYLFLGGGRVQAATLSNASDTITTSRPSASAPLNADQAANATQVTVIDNGSIYLASDSATIRPDTGETIDTGKNVASMSAQISGTPNTRIVYFTNAIINAHHKGDPVVVPITAMHTVQFTAVTNIPTNGSITLTFPPLVSGDANNPASPSATTFQLNGLSSSNIKIFSGSTDITSSTTITITNPSPGTSPTIKFTLNSSTSIVGGTTVKIYLGCSSATSSTCSTQVPTIINPTKTAAAGTADVWSLVITSRDETNGTNLDSVKVKIGTIESVQVIATVDATLTFSIAGITNGNPINTGNTTGCTNTETTNTGISSTATVVNLGTLANTPTATNVKVANISAQLLTITTNASNGYVLTATSSGSLQNPAAGFAIASSTTPAVFPNGTHWFGLHPCGLDVSTSTWVTGSDQACNTYITGSTGNLCKYGWPTQTTAVTLASDSTGPVGNTVVAGNGLVSVEYAAGVDATVPAGTYTTVVTYVVTPTF